MQEDNKAEEERGTRGAMHIGKEVDVRGMANPKSGGARRKVQSHPSPV
jgi:hypothetical protein